MKNYLFSLPLFVLLNYSLYVFSQKGQSSLGLEKTDETTGFSPDFAIGIKASSLGLGLDATISITEKVNLRIGGSYFKSGLSYSFIDVLNAKGLNYTTLGSISILSDYHLLKCIYISGGILYNYSELEIKTDITENISFGEITLSPEAIGFVEYKYTPNKICPYLGIGFGQSISKNKLLSFNCDIGMIYQGSPKVELNATGIFTPTENEEQIKLLEDNVKEYKFYPFLNLQLNLKIISSNH